MIFKNISIKIYLKRMNQNKGFIVMFLEYFALHEKKSKTLFYTLARHFTSNYYL